MKGLERRTTTLNLSQINESLKCLFGIIPAAREREREREWEMDGRRAFWLWSSAVIVIIICLCLVLSPPLRNYDLSLTWALPSWLDTHFSSTEQLATLLKVLLWHIKKHIMHLGSMYQGTHPPTSTGKYHFTGDPWYTGLKAAVLMYYNHTLVKSKSIKQESAILFIV